MSDTRLVDLSHVITDGMTTYPGLPRPRIETHLSREAAEEIYGSGTSFHIGLVTLCTNTGTYLDVPFHRFADGHDLFGWRSNAWPGAAVYFDHDKHHDGGSSDRGPVDLRHAERCDAGGAT